MGGSRRARTSEPYHPLIGGTDVTKKTPGQEVSCGRERARTSEPYHPLFGGTDVIKKTPGQESLVGARGLEPPNLTDVNRAL